MLKVNRVFFFLSCPLSVRPVKLFADIYCVSVAVRVSVSAFVLCMKLSQEHLFLWVCKRMSKYTHKIWFMMENIDFDRLDLEYLFQYSIIGYMTHSKQPINGTSPNIKGNTHTHARCLWFVLASHCIIVAVVVGISANAFAASPMFNTREGKNRIYRLFTGY